MLTLAAQQLADNIAVRKLHRDARHEVARVANIAATREEEARRGTHAGPSSTLAEVA